MWKEKTRNRRDMETETERNQIGARVFYEGSEPRSGIKRFKRVDAELSEELVGLLGELPGCNVSDL
jgi:hypothetical protein